MNDKVAEWRDKDMPDAVVTSVWITKQGSVQSPLVDQSIYIQFCIVNWLSKNYGGSIMFCQRIQFCIVNWLNLKSGRQFIFSKQL